MKKAYILIILLFSLTAFTIAQESAPTKVANAIVAVPPAVATAGTMVNNALVNGTTALHKDVVDGVSTLHQDLVAVTTTVYPDAKGVINTIYTDSKKAIDYLVPKVESVISALATGLKTTTAEVWRILVYKQVALGVTALIYFFVALLLLIIYAVGVNKVLKVVKTMNGYWGGGQTAFVWAGAIASAFLLVFMAQQIPVMVNGFVVPEAGALKEAVGLTQQLIGTFK